ncbi:antibiotic acetyltransferase [Candidatus Micrarchaeota archaeon]|nr:antibiotic acetyltransferase [Candidatus Micrarchaeota archaeon]
MKKNAVSWPFRLIGKITTSIQESWTKFNIMNSTKIQVSKNVNIRPGFRSHVPLLCVGKGSRIQRNFLCKGNYEIDIGKYCAFGEGVRIITTNHRTDLPSINLKFYKKNFGCTPLGKSGPVKIGNDVWVGDRVIILPKVTIGDGAVLGAGAVITKNVPPYAIVTGVPGKIRRFRFGREQQKKLLEIKWWDWNDEKIKRNKEFFMGKT